MRKHCSFATLGQPEVLVLYESEMAAVAAMVGVNKATSQCKEMQEPFQLVASMLEVAAYNYALEVSAKSEYEPQVFQFPGMKTTPEGY